MVSRSTTMTGPFIQATFKGGDQQESESEEQSTLNVFRYFYMLTFVRITTQRTENTLTSEEQTNMSDVGKTEFEEEETSGSEE